MGDQKMQMGMNDEQFYVNKFQAMLSVYSNRSASLRMRLLKTKILDYISLSTEIDAFQPNLGKTMRTALNLNQYTVKQLFDLGFEKALVVLILSKDERLFKMLRK